MHLKVIQQMSRIPRSVGGPPLSDPKFEEAVTSQAALLESSPSGSAPNAQTSMMPLVSGENDGRINPLAAMGLTDDQYNMMLTSIVNGETFMGGIGMDFSVSGEKRTLEESGEDARDGKRSRFEVVE